MRTDICLFMFQIFKAFKCNNLKTERFETSLIFSTFLSFRVFPRPFTDGGICTPPYGGGTKR